jgi:hypothetical protein
MLKRAQFLGSFYTYVKVIKYVLPMNNTLEIRGLPEVLAVESTEPGVPVGEPAPDAEQDYLQNAVEVGGLVAISVLTAVVLSALSDSVRSRWP